MLAEYDICGEVDMLLNGLSIKGSYHSKNQDSYACQKIDDSYIVAVSDGLGSKKSSELGSAALCRSACDIVSEYRDEISDMNVVVFIRLVYERWIYRLKGEKISDCYATMLILLVLPKRIVAIRLGDGFVAFWTDNGIEVLLDQKEDHFVNETDCLTEVFMEDKIQYSEVAYSEFHGGILCSDGVGIGNMTEKEVRDFTMNFIEEYRSYSESDLIKDVEGWLEDWTGTDDKTLAFVLAEEGK